jgi:putative photosynthetic complex assembly protein 2
MHLSAAALSFGVGCWIERAHSASAGSGAETGFTLLAALTALALMEHWFMMLPVRDTALWGLDLNKTRDGGRGRPASDRAKGGRDGL